MPIASICPTLHLPLDPFAANGLFICTLSRVTVHAAQLIVWLRVAELNCFLRVMSPTWYRSTNSRQYGGAELLHHSLSLGASCDLGAVQAPLKHPQCPVSVL